MKAIAAMDEDRGIGKNGTLPWKVSDDFKWFKEFTLHKTLVVGSATYMNLPILKQRKLIILHRARANDSFYNPAIDSVGYYAGNLDVIVGLDKIHKGELIVIGGAKTYELLLPYITEFYVTHIKGSYDADVFMPAFEHLFTEQEVVREFDGHKVVKYSK